MTLLGFRLDKDLRNELENNFENELVFAGDIAEFVDFVKHKKFESIVIEEKNLQEDGLINLIKMTKDYQKKGVIIVLGETSNLKVVAGSIKAGAYDYILKPMETAEIIKIIEKSVKDFKLIAQKIDSHKNTGEKLIGQSKQIVELYKMIGKVASSRLPVLVIGEKGTGKNSVAKAIHQFSNWADKPLVSLNCTSYQGDLLERKLFGYEKGAFPGALYTQIGELEKAGGGTLHLGNIESLSLEMQTKLLYLLEEGRFFRLGGVNPQEVDVRVVATTSVNLEERINQGKFIDELYRKLKILEISIPPLRERVDDIPLIIEHYLQECNMELHKNVKGVSKPALKKILRHDWPGNVNELKTAIKSAVALCRGTSILMEDLPSNVLGTKVTRKKGEALNTDLREWIKSEINIFKKNNEHDYYQNIISKVEKELIHQILQATNGKKVETAQILGITRNTLRTKMSNYGLE